MKSYYCVIPFYPAIFFDNWTFLFLDPSFYCWVSNEGTFLCCCLFYLWRVLSRYLCDWFILRFCSERVILLTWGRSFREVAFWKAGWIFLLPALLVLFKVVNIIKWCFMSWGVTWWGLYFLTWGCDFLAKEVPDWVVFLCKVLILFFFWLGHNIV